MKMVAVDGKKYPTDLPALRYSPHQAPRTRGVWIAPSARPMSRETGVSTTGVTKKVSARLFAALGRF